ELRVLAVELDGGFGREDALVAGERGVGVGLALIAALKIGLHQVFVAGGGILLALDQAAAHHQLALLVAFLAIGFGGVELFALVGFARISLALWCSIVFVHPRLRKRGGAAH